MRCSDFFTLLHLPPPLGWDFGCILSQNCLVFLGFFRFFLFFFFFKNSVNNNRCSLRLQAMQRIFWGLISPRLGISHTRLLS